MKPRTSATAQPANSKTTIVPMPPISTSSYQRKTMNGSALPLYSTSAKESALSKAPLATNRLSNGFPRAPSGSGECCFKAESAH